MKFLHLVSFIISSIFLLNPAFGQTDQWPKRTIKFVAVLVPGAQMILWLA